MSTCQSKATRAAPPDGARILGKVVGVPRLL